MRRVKWGPRGWWDCLGDLCQGQCCWGEAEQEASSYDDQLTEAFAEMSDYSSAPSAPQRLRYQL
ncbi:hypothetical protein RchiOBHm_Chr2g0169501 [Rosa chinensis]|uniref:Uncharacterized protein n=1 Tax=Rosa chinensis TaxID=74649 RepID=A0A2P6S4X9_ROSCH|nr:hypothetical protein RchiOBHm_Chr2g0169501 [Rosa chinensis]